MKLGTRFVTPEYVGVWLPFSERHELRALIELRLREELGDLNGKLIVDERGPHWESELVSLMGLSYSHTDDIAILCFSNTHEIGVDIESVDRKFSVEPAQIASRFFHPEEARALKSPSEVLVRWVQKEAYAKLTRDGLKSTLKTDFSEWVQLPMFKKIVKMPVGYEGWVALRSEKPCSPGI